MSRKIVALAFLAYISVCGWAPADPVLTVSDNGLVGMNRQWLIEVAPDPTLFSGGNGSLQVELAFEVTGSELVSAVANAIDWPFANPGNNPFTGGITLGLQTDLADDTVFASFGSDLFSSGADVQVLTIETMGSGSTTLSWGGHTLLGGTPNEYIGSRIAQAGSNFDQLMGSLSAGISVTGDFNMDGNWDCTDINLLTSAIANGSTDLAFDMNGDGSITFADVTDAGDGWLAVGGANNAGATGGNAFLVGDATLDGAVDGQDFIAWNTAKFTSNTNWCDGNFNGDSVVDGQDFVDWNSNKFMSSDSAPSAVPEPALGWAAIVMAAALMLRRPWTAQSVQTAARNR